ncbi:hypothetical protein ABZW38_16035 [Streptomyces bacillaris]|uniref:hypothetical protein n=1 Tax=Streptomyces bacillaris TaxID=68179 RepID=UPI003460269F
MPNPALEAAHRAVPEIAEWHDRKQRVAQLAHDTPAVDSPEIEARKVADEALTEFLATGTWPADVEARAQAAYTRAAGAQAVRARLLEANREYTHPSALTTLREIHRTEILAALGSQLDDLLAQARKHTSDLGAIRTADDALTAGGKTAEAYTKLRALVPALANIRAAQWDALKMGELTGAGSLFQRAKDSGFGDVRGVTDYTPAEQFLAMQEQRYDVGHLVYLAQIGTAYVPEDVETVISAQDAYESRGSVPDEAPVLDLSPIVIPNQPASQPKPARPTHERRRVANDRARRAY